MCPAQPDDFQIIRLRRIPKSPLFTLIIPNSSFLIPNSHSVVIRWENNSSA